MRDEENSGIPAVFSPYCQPRLVILLAASLKQLPGNPFCSPSHVGGADLQNFHAITRLVVQEP